MSRITFLESVGDYPHRTIENIQASDATIAIASNFNSFGEVLTAKWALRSRKPYIPYKFNTGMADSLRWYNIGQDFKSRGVSIINIAGNGIYEKTLPTQNIVDDLLYLCLSYLTSSYTPVLIRSGGQTGVDEAAIKAAVRLKIPALILAPKGWKFRDINREDIKNEQLFKQRFADFL